MRDVIAQIRLAVQHCGTTTVKLTVTRRAAVDAFGHFTLDALTVAHSSGVEFVARASMVS